MERLQKVMAAAGAGSRRACEKLITDGLVKVDGRTVTELGTKVDAARSQITVNGKPLKPQRRHVYFKLHKPRGVLSDIGGDTRGRESVADLLPPELRRVFTVGRLDLNSEGLVLLTDDGALANRLTHPRYQHPKTYFVLLEKRPQGPELKQLHQGITLPDGYVTAPARVDVVERLPSELALAAGRTNGTWLRMVLREGKKRQIRHMTAAVGHPTLRLVRWSIGPLTLGNLRSRTNGPLTRQEVVALQQLANPSVHNEPAKTRRPSNSKRPHSNRPSTGRPGANRNKPSGGRPSASNPQRTNSNAARSASRNASRSNRTGSNRSNAGNRR